MNTMIRATIVFTLTMSLNALAAEHAEYFTTTVNFLTKEGLESRKAKQKLEQADGSFKEGIWPSLQLPQLPPELGSKEAKVYFIDRNKITLEENGVEVISARDNAEFVGILRRLREERNNPDLALMNSLKEQLVRTLDSIMADWLKTKGDKYKSARWTPTIPHAPSALLMRDSTIEIATKSLRKPANVAHIDYLDRDEMYRFYSQLYPEIELNIAPPDAEFVQLWIPFEEKCIGQPLAVFNLKKFDFKRDVTEFFNSAGDVPGGLNGAVEFDPNFHELLTAGEDFPEGDFLVLRTFESGHVAVIRNANIPRISGEIRGFVSF